MNDLLDLLGNVGGDQLVGQLSSQLGADPDAGQLAGVLSGASSQLGGMFKR